MTTIRTTTALAASAALATVALAAPAATAGDDDGRVEKRGSCSGTTDWKLKAKHDDGRIEVEYEVDSNRNGQTWRWRILHDGDLSARGTKQTRPPSGSFEVRRLLVDTRGDDVIAWRFPAADQEIQYGAALTVRESQMAVFVNEGRLADVFGPGMYKLTTQTLPVLTYLQNWDKLQSEYDCFYFVADRHALTSGYADTSEVVSSAW